MSTTNSILWPIGREAAAASLDAHGEKVRPQMAWEFITGMLWDLEDEVLEHIARYLGLSEEAVCSADAPIEFMLFTSAPSTLSSNDKAPVGKALALATTTELGEELARRRIQPTGGNREGRGTQAFERTALSLRGNNTEMRRGADRTLVSI